MLSKSPIVALVGRVNVGKSTLFNALSGKKKSIISTVAGTTRDYIVSHITWRGKNFDLIDTPGKLPKTKNELEREIDKQTEYIVNKADLLVYLADSEVGITANDRLTAKYLTRLKKPVVLAVNKCDSPKDDAEAYKFFNLGLGKPFPVSAVGGRGTGDLLDQLARQINKKSFSLPATEISLAIAGKPNTGKSTLLNKLANNNRSTVSSEPNTTRDAIDIVLPWKDLVFRIIDTAGLRKKAKTNKMIDRMSSRSSLAAIRESSIVLLLTDASVFLTSQDVHIANKILDYKKGVIIVANKYDKVETTMERLVQEYQYRLPFLYFAPIVFVSAKTGLHLEQIFPLAASIQAERKRVIEKNALSRFLKKIIKINPPSQGRGKRKPEIYKLSQIAIAPPVFKMEVREGDRLPGIWLKYFEREIRKKFGYRGVPLTFKITHTIKRSPKITKKR